MPNIYLNPDELQLTKLLLSYHENTDILIEVSGMANADDLLARILAKVKGAQKEWPQPQPPIPEPPKPTAKGCRKFHFNCTLMNGQTKHEIVIARDPFEAEAILRQRIRSIQYCNVIDSYVIEPGD